MTRITLLLLLFSQSLLAQQIQIVDKQNQPVKNAVVWLKGSKQLAVAESHYTMSQKERAFVPHVLAVPQGANVEFPNLDSIMHHVYSFSKTKQFELKLYHDKPEKPINFAQSGVVELGCNIHDWMLGYIVVVDGGIYGQTDDQGMVELSLPESKFTLAVWHDRFNDISTPETIEITNNGKSVSYQLKQNLLPKLELSSDEFDDYE
ncbi:methylamine utilization protein [Pseudoalteromonas sp. PA2MD11]|uniref:methylamine utilization protein n=1 Tax=Pseudoalteromonas sp. PA2MD11 TaxID=2785057 RepID=UPI001ADEF307|nr:methylamine utilization protein [Pseudoalteromonas sp. PA2MD11]